MTIAVANTANTNTFQYWIDRTNEMAHAMSNKVVSAESNAAIGNAQLIGTFTANTLEANAGFINGERILTESDAFPPQSTNTSGTSGQIMDATAFDTYRAVEYFVSITDNDANAFHVTKLLCFHDGTNGYLSEYGVIFSNTSLATFTLTTNSTHMRAVVTPTSSNTTINYIATKLPI